MIKHLNNKDKLPTLILEEDLYNKLLQSPEYADYLCYDIENQCYLLNVAKLQENNYYLPICDDYVAGILLVDKINDILSKYGDIDWIVVKMKKKDNSFVYPILDSILNNYKNENKEFSFLDIYEEIEKEFSKRGIKDSPVSLGVPFIITNYLEFLESAGIIRKDSVKHVYKFKKTNRR